MQPGDAGAHTYLHCSPCLLLLLLQAQLSNALASLDSATASVAEQQEIINNLQVEGTGAQPTWCTFASIDAHLHLPASLHTACLGMLVRTLESTAHQALGFASWQSMQNVTCTCNAALPIKHTALVLGHMLVNR